MATKGERRAAQLFWISMILLALAALYILQEILLPFVLGFAIAYLLDPLVDMLQKVGITGRDNKKRTISRGHATLIALTLFSSIVVAIISMLVPVVQAQVISIAQTVPRYLKELSGYARPYYDMVLGQVSLASEEGQVTDLAGKHVSTALGLMSGAFKKLVEGGAILFSLFSVVIITPIVSFYLLRDWDNIMRKVDGWLPRKHADTIRTQILLIDQSLSGFVRGQGLVCLILGIFYATSLSIIGLDFGLTIGLFTGFMSFVPYFGSGLGMTISIVVALKEFSDWLSVALVLGIFMVGQFLEGYVLSPRLVGERVGLHAVWIIFALMAGGSLFGFVGILLAVPLAAALGVLFRFAIDQYKQSTYYTG